LYALWGKLRSTFDILHVGFIIEKIITGILQQLQPVRHFNKISNDYGADGEGQCMVLYKLSIVMERCVQQQKLPENILQKSSM
jgi:hypothetical protein